MKTVKKNIKLFIDLMPLMHSEHEPVGIVAFANETSIPMTGYNRFKVSVVIDCPLVSEEADLGTLSAEIEAVEVLDDETEEE